MQECSIVPMQLLSDTEIDIYHAPSHLRYDAPPLDNARDSPHGSRDTLTTVHHTLPQLITPPDSQASTRDPTPHIADVPSSDQYHISPPPRTDAKPNAELNSRREMTQEVRQNARNDRRSTADVRVIHPRLVRDHSVCQRRAQASQAEDDHQYNTHDMNVSADQRNIPPNPPPIPEADDERPAKGQNTAPRAREISADIRESNIITGKRERKPYNAQAMAFDASSIPMVPFYSSFTVAWDCSRLSKVIAEDSFFDYQPYLSQCDIWPNISKACASLAVNAVTDKIHGTALPPPPKNFRDMEKHPHRDAFQKAADDEFRSLSDRNTWEIVDRSDVPFGEKIIPLAWVFTYKIDPDGYLIKHKARIVARGDLQDNVNAHSVYAYTLAIAHFRILMALIACCDLEAHGLDVKNAFVNADRSGKPVYCYLPPGYQQKGKVVKVLKALYGFCESPLDWYIKYTTKLDLLGFVCTSDEKCLWYHPDFQVFIFFHVDDSIVAGPPSGVARIKAALMKEFDMTDFGPVSWFLGIRVIRDRPTRRLYLCQDAYIERVMKNFKDIPISKGNIPISPYTDISKATDNEEPNSGFVKEYQTIVGSLNWAAVATRPDISHVISVLADSLTRPRQRHMDAARQVVAYLYATRYQALCYSGMPISGLDSALWLRPLHAASDASYADNSGRISSQGYLFRFFGAAVVWNATKQRTVATSTTEAELLALSAAARELIATIRFLQQFGFKFNQDVTIVCDNKQTVDIINKDAPILATKLRHVDIHQHWLRQLVHSGVQDSGIDATVTVSWVDTKSMPADGLTKRLSSGKHAKFLKQLGLMNVARLVSN